MVAVARLTTLDFTMNLATETRKWFLVFASAIEVFITYMRSVHLAYMSRIHCATYEGHKLEYITRKTFLTFLQRDLCIFQLLSRAQQSQNTKTFRYATLNWQQTIKIPIILSQLTMSKSRKMSAEFIEMS